MNKLQEKFEASGRVSWINSDIYPNGKIPTQEYVSWLETQVNNCRSSKELVAIKSDGTKEDGEIIKDYFYELGHRFVIDPCEMKRGYYFILIRDDGFEELIGAACAPINYIKITAKTINTKIREKININTEREAVIVAFYEWSNGEVLDDKSEIQAFLSDYDKMTIL